jgi:hypothetical protein
MTGEKLKGTAGTGQRPATATRYAAAMILAPARCCLAVQAVANQQFLATEAPLLPLRDCTMPGQCQCRYQKAPDRRADESSRRDDLHSVQVTWFGGKERRRSPGRRRKD